MEICEPTYAEVRYKLMPKHQGRRNNGTDCTGNGSSFMEEDT